MAFATLSLRAVRPIAPVSDDERDVCPACGHDPGVCNQLAQDGIAVCPEAYVPAFEYADRTAWDELGELADRIADREEVLRG